jgi:hypothetical protein
MNDNVCAQLSLLLEDLAYIHETYFDKLRDDRVSEEFWMDMQTCREVTTFLIANINPLYNSKSQGIAAND